MDWAFIGPIMLGLRGDWSTALRTRRERRELRSSHSQQEEGRQAGRARQDKRQTDAILDCALNRTELNRNRKNID